MRYAFVCFFPAVPAESGAGRVSYDLARLAPGERTLVQLGPSDDAWLDLRGLEVVQLRQRGNDRWAKALGVPLFVARVVQRLKRSPPDVVVLEGASWVLYHWWLLRALRKAIPAAAIVYHAHNVEYELRRDKHGPLVRRVTRWAEGRLLRAADRSFAASDIDRRAFASLYGAQVSLLPNGVDVSQFANVSDADVLACRTRYGLGSETILFMGAYGYKPNREAIDFLVMRVMPLVLQTRPHACLAIIGGAVPYRRDWLRSPGVIPDKHVAPVLRACAVSVAPIFSGSGTRLKILTSLAAGVPVVSTRKGAEGLDLVESVEILYAERAESFASTVLKVLAQPAVAAAVALGGKEKVSTSYDWNRIVGVFHREMTELASPVRQEAAD